METEQGSTHHLAEGKELWVPVEIDASEELTHCVIVHPEDAVVHLCRLANIVLRIERGERVNDSTDNA